MERRELRSIFGATLNIRARVEKEPVQHGEDDWEPGEYFTQRIYVMAQMNAGVAATLLENGTVELRDAQFEERIEVPWEDIAREIE